MALKKALAGVEGEFFIFGSRVDDEKKGGDVDLLIFSDEKPFALSVRVAARYFELCEEKIDVVVMDPNSLSAEQQAFLATIKRVRWQ